MLNTNLQLLRISLNLVTIYKILHLSICEVIRPLRTKDKVLWFILSVVVPYIAKKITNYASTQ